MFLRFLKHIFRLGVESLEEDGNSMEMALWLETPRSYTCKLVRGAEFVITKSKVCPLLCVGTSTSWFRLKQSKSWRKSAAERQEGVSTWMFMSPKMTTSAGEVQKVVRRFDISGMKAGFGLGGR